MSEASSAKAWDFTRAIQLVIDMQGLFADHPDWTVPDVKRIRNEVHRVAQRKPGRTFWTRFVPAENAEKASGCWRRYYELWPRATLQGGGAQYVELLPEHRTLAGKAAVFDKPGFSAFSNPKFSMTLKVHEIDTLILSGVETDVCVWATALDAVDIGMSVVLARDAMASGSPEAHEAVLNTIAPRFESQVKVMAGAELDSVW